MLKDYLSLIKFSHTIFALPFAILGFSIGVTHHTQDYLPYANIFLLVLAAMITARSAAMAFNRYIDRKYDGQNMRTAIREIPSGKIKANHVLLFVVVFSILFIYISYLINPLCFYLSPIALLVVLGYSYTKRFTALCHLILGVGLGLAPLGAYLAVVARFSMIPIIIGFGVLFWVSGFDIIYALQDEEFDKKLGLKSIPSILGKSRALVVSRVLHFLSALLILTAVYLLKTENKNLGFLSYFACIFFILLLVYQHTLVKADDLKRVNLAFFTTNGIASVIFCSLVVTDIFYI